MDVRIVRGVRINRAMERLIREQVVGRLERFARAIGEVVVELTDRNGRRGGGDKRVRIELVVAGERVRMEDVGANLRTVVRHAVSRVEGAVRRRVKGSRQG